MSQLAVDIVLGLVRSSPAIADVIGTLAGINKATIEARLLKARAAIADPVDTTAEDAAHRAELEAILRGEG